MGVLETFGTTVTNWSDPHPIAARRLLAFGFRANGIKNRIAPGGDSKGDQMIFQQMNQSLIHCLTRPDRNAMVSLFTPCEMLHVLGLQPYCAEAYSGYLSGSMAEQGFLKRAEAEGIPTSLCSFHKAFIGAAQTGVMPRPKFILHTNIACDANTLTFKYLADYFDVPRFAIDVPFEQSDDAVREVAGQLRAMQEFIEDQTGTRVDEIKLKDAVARGYHTEELYVEYLKRGKNKELLRNLTAELFRAGTLQIMLGSKESEDAIAQLVSEAKEAPEAKGVRLAWIHTTPFWVPTLKDLMNYSQNVQIAGCDMSYAAPLMGFDYEKPYETMARRLVYSSFNGPVERRIARAKEIVDLTGADGVVWFCHWGCKHTLGGAQLAKKELEAAGIPTLILDGDSCDRAFGGEGQMLTRMEAFLELLQEKKK